MYEKRKLTKLNGGEYKVKLYRGDTLKVDDSPGIIYVEESNGHLTEIKQERLGHYLFQYVLIPKENDTYEMIAYIPF